ncbi:MAG: DUF5687 family protein [Candidatus Helarchaeota archaeon]
MNLAALLRTIFYFDWLRLKRAPQFKGNLTLRIITAMLTIYLLVNCLTLGYFIDVLVDQNFPDINIVAFINQQILYFFVFLTIIRFFYEKLPQVNFHFFLCLPISKSQLILNYIFRTVCSKFNLLLLCIVLPFWIKNILSDYSFIGTLYWLLGFILLNFFFTLIGLLLKFLFFETKWGSIFLLFAAIFIIGFDLLSRYAIIKNISAFLFDSLLQAVFLVFVSCVIIVLTIIFLTFKLLKKSLYLDSC